jgi:hypothetical protein
MGELKKVSKEDFALTSKRNYAAEKQRAQLSLFHDLEGLRSQREAGDIPVWQVALCLILCGLPYNETSERSYTRRARLGDGSWLTVTFTATGKRYEQDENGEPVVDPTTGEQKETLVPLPYGADRGPLHYLINQAVLQAKELQRQGLDTSAARFVQWETANQYLAQMGKSTGGKNRDDLRARIDRIKFCAITVTRTARGGREKTLLTPMFSRTDLLPRSLDSSKRVTKPSEQGISKTPAVTGVEFGQEFFEEFLLNHMPVPVHLLRSTMGRSQMQDYVLWLYWRAFAAKQDTLIPWPAVREQLWQNDATKRRLYTRLKAAIATLRSVWPELRAEVNPKSFGPEGKQGDGLMIGPPRNGIYMFPGSSAPKQITVIPSASSPRKR